MGLEGQLARTSGAEIKVVIEVGCRGTGREQKPRRRRQSKWVSKRKPIALEVRRFAYFEICVVHELSEVVHRVVVE